VRLEDRLRNALAELLPRWLAIALRVRRVGPIRGREPWTSYQVDEAGDTGGGFRAAWRPQDPSKDPREPGGGESSSAGTDHGWANCTMSSGAMALAYQQPRGALAPWGGDLRHSGQSDLSGGTDLYDVRDAWEELGEVLTIKSGAGWSAVRTARSEGRAIVIQGEGNVPGSEAFSGGHGCVISPEEHSGGSWLFGDPLASGWQWVSESSIRSWAEAWQSSIAFAVGEKPPATPPPTPTPTPPPAGPAVDLEAVERVAEERGREGALDDQVGEWVRYVGPPGPIAGGVWSASSWVGSTASSIAYLVEECDDPGAVWGRGPVPDPVAAAANAIDTPREWDRRGWRELLWR
jgi:hypothetical protein